MRSCRCVLLLALCPLAGCGPGKGKVSGQVLLDGQPLPGGVVTFRHANPRFNPVTVTLDEQGRYEAELPAGEVQVSVDNRSLQPPRREALPPDVAPQLRQVLAREGAGQSPSSPPPPPEGETAISVEKPPGRYVPILEKYHDMNKSGLDFTVQPGDQEHRIELRSR